MPTAPSPSNTWSLISLRSTSFGAFSLSFLFSFSTSSTAWCTTSLAVSTLPIVLNPGRIPNQLAVTMNRKMVITRGKKRRPFSRPATLSVRFRKNSKTTSSRLCSRLGTSPIRRPTRNATAASTRMVSQVAIMVLVILKSRNRASAVIDSAGSCMWAIGEPRKPPPNSFPSAPPATLTMKMTTTTARAASNLGLPRNLDTIPPCHRGTRRSHRGWP